MRTGTSARADRDGGGRAWSDRPQNGRIGPGAASARTCSARRTAVSDAKSTRTPSSYRAPAVQRSGSRLFRQPARHDQTRCCS